MADYVMTIDSDSEDYALPKPSKSTKAEAEDAGLNPEFIFDVSGDPYMDIVSQDVELGDLVKTGTKPVRRRIEL